MRILLDDCVPTVSALALKVTIFILFLKWDGQAGEMANY